MYEQKKTIDYYNKESNQYTKKRYDGSMSNYSQYIFRKRMSLLFNYITYIRYKSLNKNKTLFDIGCADGIVLFSLNDRFADFIDKIVAVDISDEMIKVAKNKTTEAKFSFYMRGDEPELKCDVVTELGVHVSDLKKEMEYVESRLNTDGYYIYSTGDKNSIYARLKLKGKPNCEYVKDYMTLHDIEIILKTKFNIIKKTSYGFFIPKLWSVPFLARIVQPTVDFFLSILFPSLFHETLYLLTISNKK